MPAKLAEQPEPQLSVCVPQPLGPLPPHSRTKTEHVLLPVMRVTHITMFPVVLALVPPAPDVQLPIPDETALQSPTVASLVNQISDPQPVEQVGAAVLQLPLGVLQLAPEQVAVALPT